MPCSVTLGRVLDDRSRLTIMAATLASAADLLGAPDLSIESCPSPTSAIEARLVSPSASGVILSGLPACVFADRPLELMLAAVAQAVGAGTSAKSVSHLISTRVHISLEFSGISHDVQVSLRPSSSGWVARALVRPASWADAATVTVASLTIAGQRLPCKRLPAALRVGYNHAPADEGNVLWAAEADDVPALQAALDAGGSTEEADDQRRTGLYWAAFKGFLDALRTLLAAGANPVPVDKRGSTPLHWAAFNGHAPVVALLLATPGVDPLAKERNGGYTPLDHARRNGKRTAAVAAVLQADPRVAAALAGAAAVNTG